MNKKKLTPSRPLMVTSTTAVVSAADMQKISGVEFNIPEGHALDLIKKKALNI